MAPLDRRMEFLGFLREASINNPSYIGLLMRAKNQAETFIIIHPIDHMDFIMDYYMDNYNEFLINKDGLRIVEYDAADDPSDLVNILM